MSTYESAPGTAPIRIVPYPARRPSGQSIPPSPASTDVPVSYEELIRNAAIDIALDDEALSP